MDGDERNSAAVVVNFDGSDGLIVVDNVWLTTGKMKARGGKWLYISLPTRTFMGGGEPDVRYIHRN